MSENSITVKNMSKKFRVYHEKRTTLFESITGGINRKPHHETLQVLDDISFNVKKGESFGIVGKNGSGKTTLLRILSNIYQTNHKTELKHHLKLSICYFSLNYLAKFGFLIFL